MDSRRACIKWNSSHVVCVHSGTAALFCALQSVNSNWPRFLHDSWSYETYEVPQ